MIPQTSYEAAEAFADSLVHGDIALAVGRFLGNSRAGQIAVALALTTCAGNAVAALVDDERAETLHRQRAAFHRGRAVKRISIARRR